MRLANKQRGMTTASMMLIGVIVALIVITLIKLYPAYYDDFAVKTTLRNVAEMEGAGKMSPKDIRSTITRRLQVNSIDSVKDEHIAIDRDKGKTTITVNYEVRTSLYGNLDAISTFTHSVEIDD